MTQVAQQTTGWRGAIRPFPNLNVSAEELAELRRRISATRWPAREIVTDDSQGVAVAGDGAGARALLRGSDYDWRKCEAND